MKDCRAFQVGRQIWLVTSERSLLKIQVQQQKRYKSALIEQSKAQSRWQTYCRWKQICIVSYWYRLIKHDWYIIQCTYPRSKITRQLVTAVQFWMCTLVSPNCTILIKWLQTHSYTDSISTLLFFALHFHKTWRRHIVSPLSIHSLWSFITTAVYNPISANLTRYSMTCLI